MEAYLYDKQHTAKCTENAKVQANNFEKLAEESFAKMKAQGVDVSKRGIGFQFECICKTQETQ